MSVAIIAEDFAGMRAQASGLVERAGLDWHFHPVRIEGVWRRIPTRFCPDPLRATSPIMLPSGTDMLVSVEALVALSLRHCERRRASGSSRSRIRAWQPTVLI